MIVLCVLYELFLFVVSLSKQAKTNDTIVGDTIIARWLNAIPLKLIFSIKVVPSRNACFGLFQEFAHRVWLLRPAVAVDCQFFQYNSCDVCIKLFKEAKHLSARVFRATCGKSIKVNRADVTVRGDSAIKSSQK